MSKWYRNFEHTQLWSALENAIRMLEEDGSLTCSKGREPVIGFIHHQLDARFSAIGGCPVTVLVGVLCETEGDQQESR